MKDWHSNSRRRRIARRRGFSLLEMLLSLAILGGSLAILSRIVETGTDAAIESRSLSAARLACQSKLSEVLLDVASGITPQPVSTVPMESFDASSTTPLSYSVEVVPSTMEGILAVRVSVFVQGDDVQSSLASYSLTRWIVDPDLGLEEAEAAEEEAAAAAEEGAEL